MLRAATPDLEVWIARFGRLIEKRPNGQVDLLYDTLVNTMRAQVPASVEFVCAKATAISTGADRQRLTLSSGEDISARLIVLANGLNIGLRQSLGIGREILSACHSISIGFDLAPVGRQSFDFRALTYYPERAAAGMAYLTLFPIGSTMRANLFVYRDMDDPWLREMRHAGRDALFALMPGLRKLTGDVEVTDVKIRPVDLYRSTGYGQAGIVLVGDAFGTSCPAAGTGCNKVFTDVERLCNVHIPAWLASAGMAADKIAAFYDDAGQARLRCGFRRQGLLSALAVDRGWARLECAPLGTIRRPGGRRRAAPGARPPLGAVVRPRRRRRRQRGSLRRPAGYRIDNPKTRKTLHFFGKTCVVNARIPR